MKRTLLAATLFVATAAQADFSGAFARANWTETPGTGSVNTFVATDLSMSSGDSGIADDTSVTIVLGLAGMVSFNFAYTPEAGVVFPGGDPFFDPFSVLVPADTPVVDEVSDPFSGSYSFSAGAGDTIGFLIRTLDGAEGPATVRISNFNFRPDQQPPNPTPEPGGVALMAAALIAGIAARRKLKGAGRSA